MTVPEQARVDADHLLRARGLDPETPLAALAPGSAWATKRWTPEGFASLERWLRSRGFATVLVGTASERPLCERVNAASDDLSVNLAGATTLPVLAAVLARCRALIANDSGSGHLAAAVGTPVISIFGPTTPELGCRPLGRRVLTVELPEPLDCRPCGRHGARKCPLGHHRCMRDLSVEEVVRQIEAWELSPLRDTPRALHG
jgi:heptosyltransferase-2